MVNAQIAAQNEAVKEALETQIATLRENLNQAGVKVDAIEVTVASHEFEKNLEQNEHRGEQQQAEEASAQPSARRSIRMDSLDELSGLMTEEEILAAQIMKDNGNSVDLTA
jgi:flagellar hook-length control protein FliK